MGYPSADPNPNPAQLTHEGKCPTVMFCEVIGHGYRYDETEDSAGCPGAS